MHDGSARERKCVGVNPTGKDNGRSVKKDERHQPLLTRTFSIFLFSTPATSSPPRFVSGITSPPTPGLDRAMKRMSDNMKKHKANHRPIWRARHFWTEKGISIPTMSRDGNVRLNLGAPAGLGLVSGLQCGNCFD